MCTFVADCLVSFLTISVPHGFHSICTWEESINKNDKYITFNVAKYTVEVTTKGPDFFNMLWTKLNREHITQLLGLTKNSQ